MVPAILATRERVEVKVDAKTILAGPLNGLEEISTSSCKQTPRTQEKAHARPRDLLEEGLTIPSLDGPVTDGDTDMVQAGTGNLSEILFRLVDAQK